jgi:hypothetical protein
MDLMKKLLYLIHKYKDVNHCHTCCEYFPHIFHNINKTTSGSNLKIYNLKV